VRTNADRLTRRPAESSAPAGPIDRVGAEALHPLHGKEPVHIVVYLEHGGLPSKPNLFTLDFSMPKDIA
jgi:hypothetical protein